MTRGRVAVVVVSSLLVVARAGMARQRAKSTRVFGDVAPAPATATVAVEEVVEAAAPAPEPPPTERMAPRLASLLAGAIPVLGVLGLIVSVALVAANLGGGTIPLVGSVGDNWPLAAILLSLAVWAIYLLWKVPQWQAASWRGVSGMGTRELFEIENASRSTLGQILSGVAVLAGLLFAWQQLGNTGETLRVNQEGQITDRFTRAVDQLGNEDLTIRLGGIYGLERIARDSDRDYGPVMEVLTAFARQQAPAAGVPASAATPAAAIAVPLDVQAVLKVIGRRTPGQLTAEERTGLGCLDLSGMRLVGANLGGLELANTCFRGSDLRGAFLAGADLSRADLFGADLTGANLDGVSLPNADLTNAVLVGANLSKADLDEANLQSANLSGAILQDTTMTRSQLNGANLTFALLLGTDLTGADFTGVDLTGATLDGARLTDARNLTQAQIDAALLDAETVLPPDIRATPDF